jgi:hypothetical protein
MGPGADGERVRRVPVAARLAMLAAGAAGVLLAASLLSAHGAPGARAWLRAVPPLAWPLVVALGGLLALLVHEAGHVLGGLLGGMRFRFAAVGPLQLRGEEGRRVRLGLNRHLALASGVVACVPADARRLRARMALFTAGGPLASGVLAGLALLGVHQVAPRALSLAALPPPSALPAATLLVPAVLTAALGLGGLLSAGLLAASLLPLRAPGFLSDGARLWVLARGGAAAERWCGLAAVVGASLAGVRPRDWPEALLARATSLPDGSTDDAGATLLAYAHALDAGALDAAEEHLARVLALRARLPPALAAAVALEGAFFEAYFHADAPAARACLAQAEAGGGGGAAAVEPHVRLRAEAAVLLAEGRPVLALTRVVEGLDWLSRAWDAGGAQLERDRLEALRVQCRAVLQSEPPRGPHRARL